MKPILDGWADSMPKPSEALAYVDGGWQEVVVDRAPAPAQPLASWAVDLVAGQIQIGGAQLDPVMARDLWVRLGAVLGQADRDRDLEAWERLAHEIDVLFSRGIPATGRTIDRRSMMVEGVAVRTDDGVAFRVARYAMATLRKLKAGWEGAVYELRPTSVGHDRIHTGTRVRLSDDALPRVVAAIEAAPVPPPAPVPPVAPVAPAGVLERRRVIAAEVEELLATFGELGVRRSLDELAVGGRWTRRDLRARLEVLVDRGELRKAKDEDAWIRRTPPARGARLHKHGTVMVEVGKKTRTSRAPQAPVKRAPPPPPPCRVWRCAPCDRVVRIPDTIVEVPKEPRCGVCKGLLAPHVNTTIRNAP